MTLTVGELASFFTDLPPLDAEDRYLFEKEIEEIRQNMQLTNHAPDCDNLS